MARLIFPPYHFRPRNGPSVFLAGGITGCPDWQSTVTQYLRGTHCDVLNPRRPEFNVGDPEMGAEQIEWEFDMIDRAHIMLFWFPSETLCPITLYELGVQMGKKSYARPELVIGTHEKYLRRTDVVIQTKLAQFKGTIHDNLGAAMQELAEKIAAFPA